MVTFFEQVQLVLAQAPVNDVIGWPSGLLLLASALYAALGNSASRLWEIEPSVGLFLLRGLPVFSLKTMRRVAWGSNTCHFVPGIRSTYGISDFWVRAESITADARRQALDIVRPHSVPLNSLQTHVLSFSRQILAVLSPVIHENRDDAPPDSRLWRATPIGLIVPVTQFHFPSSAPEYQKRATATDFIYFAAIQYHVFHEWVVEVQIGGKTVFTTQGLPPNAVIDVDSETMALYIAAAAMVRRPHSQSPLRASTATKEINNEQYILNLDLVDLDAEACAIDMHSYTSPKSKIRASLRTLAHSYFMVVQSIKVRSHKNI